MNPEQAALIAASVPLVKEHGLAITRHFYQSMFAAHPELKHVFNQSNQQDESQQQALAMAVYAYAANIDQPEVLAPVLNRIAHKHASLGVQPAQYTVVGRYLMAAIKAVLGEVANDAIMEAWDLAYWLLACDLVSREARLYQQHQLAPGQSLLPLKVVAKQQETDEVVSLYLEHQEGSLLPTAISAQYVSVRIQDPQSGLWQLRQYSLTAHSETQWRITLKVRQSAWVSALLANLEVGDALDVSPPYGDFVLDPQSERPLVLLSAGVGITPMVMLLKQVADQSPNRPIVVMHGDECAASIAMLKDVQQLQRQLPNGQFHWFLQQPDLDGSHAGEVDLCHCDWPFALAESEVYLCGPLGFMQRQRQDLLAMGLNRAQLHYEVFGPDLLIGQ